MKPLLISLLLLTVISYGQIPEGYYKSAIGLTGQQLRSALQDIIDDHDQQSYASLWTHFQTTDDNINGKVWDMYSDVPGGTPSYTYTFIYDQCGTYSSEGDCYNREHSFPSSWFNDAAPMITDLFHIYPTDGYVNGKRGNYPIGEVSNATWVSSNGSKLGNSSFSGYSGIVFEPINEYKGDFARTYFYMLTRYKDQVNSWSSDMLSATDFAPWAKEMLLKWDAEDPVSLKETDRNNSVYQIQDNRNPFIDHPEFSGLIWGSPAIVDEIEIKEIKVWYSGTILHLESIKEMSGKLKLFGLLGQYLFERTFEGNKAEIPVSLKNGIYIIVLESVREVWTYKLIVSN